MTHSYLDIQVDMTHQVPDYYHVVSESLSNFLDNVGYSHEDRDRKVRVAVESEVLMYINTSIAKHGYRTYIFGSRGEGSTGPGLHSDMDHLVQDEHNKVVTDLSDCQPDKKNYLMVKDDFTHPGYVKLQSIYILPDYTPLLVYHQEFNQLVALDSLNRSVLLNTIFHKYGPVSGPALHFPVSYKELSTDNVMANRCSKWPQEGYKWFQRRRMHRWPTPKHIQNAWRYGCFATPVGHPHSSEKHLEWRLSFSIAERDLVRSFEGTAMKVYILLKMIRKTYIEPVVGDAFSSYHCKVCMLWMHEGTPRDLWRNENLLKCLILCIRQLYEWASEGFCPDYFIDTNNVYDRKLIGVNQVNIVRMLRYLLSTECRFLLGIGCCHVGDYLSKRMSGFGLYLENKLPIVREEVAEDAVYIHNVHFVRKAILRFIPQYYPSLVNYLQRLVLVSKHSPYIMEYPLKHVMMVLCSQLGFHIASVCRNNESILSSGQVDYLVTLASGFLCFGINIDATSVRLKLCGLGMELGYYDLMEVCLQHIKDHRIKYMYSVTFDDISVLNFNLVTVVENILIRRYSIEEFIQTKISFSVVYIQSEISITPTPLRMEMFRTIGAPLEVKIEDWYDWAVVDSLMCLYFFQYLNFSRQGKERHKTVAMDNMIHVIRTEPNILHRDTALNLLGYSFRKENQLANAFVCFTQSMNIRPYHNAAKFYLGLLFMTVHVTHRRQY